VLWRLRHNSATLNCAFFRTETGRERPARKTPRHKLLAPLLECCQLKNFTEKNDVSIDGTFLVV
jgi:hypothetical protein